MKSRSMKEMIVARIESRAARPRRPMFGEVRADGKGGFTRRAIDPKSFRRAQKAAWDKSIAATREKMGLSQSRFARLLASVFAHCTTGSKGVAPRAEPPKCSSASPHDILKLFSMPQRKAAR